MIKQGEVYLVNFAKKYNSEFGKIRLAVVMQNNFFNKALPFSNFKSVLLVPLTTQDIQTEYKIKLEPRDNLKEKSFIVANWLCTLDVSRILTDKGLITTLSDIEIREMKEKICNLI